MKYLLRITLAILSCMAIAIGFHIFYMHTLSAKEIYPADNWLVNGQNKGGLIMVAHDDDMAGTAATITRLCKSGWQIREVCFYQQGGIYAQKDRLKNPVRKQSLQLAAAIQGIQQVYPIDFNFRINMQTEKAYWPIPYDSFAQNFKLDSITAIIGSYINQLKPSVIFTLDDKMGGYGNPEHVVISRQLTEYCRLHKYDRGFPVKKIYQPVFPPSLSEKILEKMPVYREAKRVYHLNGMPLPDVAFNVAPFEAEKKKTMQAYTTEQNSFKQVWPYYNWYPATLYFGIFNREFFKVIDVSKL